MVAGLCASLGCKDKLKVLADFVDFPSLLTYNEIIRFLIRPVRRSLSSA